jgi:hypothetical protein
MSAAMVSAGEMAVAAAPTAAAATEASMTSVSAAMSTSMAASMAASMSTTMAAATSAGGRERWGKGDCSAEGCGSGDGDQSFSQHGGVILRISIHHA